jgi:hypothetical protein
MNESKMDQGQADAIRALLVEQANAVPPRKPVRRGSIIFGGIGLLAVGALAGGAVATAAVGITGTSADVPYAGPTFYMAQIAAFERQQSADDVPPATLPDYAFDGAKRNTARLVGTYANVSYYLMQGDTTPICVLILPLKSTENANWLVSCGGGLPFHTELTHVASVRIDREGEPIPVGWHRVDQNLFVKPED